MEKKAYIFDVDGTITPSRGVIDKEFKEFLLKASEEVEIFLVTGSDRVKTEEQIGKDLYNKCKRVYNCSGSDVYEGNKNIFTNDWRVPDKLKYFLLLELSNSEFTPKTGTHLEARPGMMNFSTVGRKANQEERKSYVKFDKETNEREQIALRIKENFPLIEAKVGGETGIDIFPVGCDKSQILKDFQDYKIYFFGDRMDKAGNDYPLSSAIKESNKGISYHIKDWEETYKILKDLII